MKPSLIFTVFFFSVWNPISAQKKPFDYFNQGTNALDSRQYNIALPSFGYLVYYCPKNDLYPEALYNYGTCFYELKQLDSAIVIFNRILSSNFKDRPDDPYTNYKNRSLWMLSLVYEAKGMYEKALYYHSLSDTLYPFQYFCGNEIEENKVDNALRYETLYLKMNRKDDAIAGLLPAVFIWLANNDKVIEDLRILLFGRKWLKEQLDRAITVMYPKWFEWAGYYYKKYYFRFLNAEIEAPASFENEQHAFDRKTSITLIHKSSFYKMIASL